MALGSLGFSSSKSSSSEQASQVDQSSAFAMQEALRSLLSGASSSSSSSALSSAQSSAQSSAASNALMQLLAQATGSSSGAATSQQSVFGGDVLTKLYEQAAGAAGSAIPAGAVERLFSGGLDVLERLGLDDGIGAYIDQRLRGPGAASEQLRGLGADLSTTLAEQILPAIRGNAIRAGQLGGGREGVAAGIASQEIIRQLAARGGELYAADQAARDQLALQASLLGATNANAAGGLLSALGGLGGQLDPYSRLLQSIGSPTVLTQQASHQLAQQQESTAQTASEIASESASQVASQQAIESQSAQAQQFAQELASEFGISQEVASSIMSYIATSKGKAAGIKLGF